MILAIDVGNSNIVLGGIDNEKIYFTVRLSTDRFKSNDEYAVLIKNLIELNGYDPADMEGSIISTVVPALGHDPAACFGEDHRETLHGGWQRPEDGPEYPD